MNSGAAEPYGRFAEEFAGKTRDNPAFIHVDFIGLIRLGKTNRDRLEMFFRMLDETSRLGGNVCFPAFTLSYTKNEVFDVMNTPSSDIGMLSEKLRERYPHKRTYDGLFSYTVVGDKISGKQFSPADFETFGKGSLIDQVFESDGYLCSIGGVFRNSTEIHYIEKLLEVDYRHDKFFEGYLIDASGKMHRQKIKYFCKNFDYNLWYDFAHVESEIKSEGMFELFSVEDFPLVIEMVKFREVFSFIESKLKNDKHYLIKELKDKRADN